MTAKRFINEDGCWGYYTEIIDNEKELDLSLPNPKKNLTIGELVELLNQFQEENKKLKQVNEMLQMDFAMTERNLIEENEQLKQRIKELELLNDGLKYALQNIRKIDVEIDVGDKNDCETIYNNG